MHCTSLHSAIATTTPVDSCTVRTPQRTACYHDKNRIRLKEAKKWGLVASGCFSSKEVKYWLKKLSLRLSLRMTSAWVAIWKELVQCGGNSPIVYDLLWDQLSRGNNQGARTETNIN